MQENRENQEHSENSKKRRQLVRQKANTETDFEDSEVSVLLEDERSPSRIIYKETIDIPASPSVSPGPEWQSRQCFLSGSARYLPRQCSGQSHHSLSHTRNLSSHSHPGVVWTHLRKQQSLTVEKTSRSSSPSPPSPSPSSSKICQKSLMHEKSLSSNSGHDKFFGQSKPSPTSPWSESGRYLPKQYSCTSNSSAYLSPQNNSCSLVDIPTYLGYQVQLATVTYDSPNTITKINKQLLPVKTIKKPARKTQWTKWSLFCISMGFLTVCIVLVGTMLSYTSAYQDREVARNMFYNVPANTTHS